MKNIAPVRSVDELDLDAYLGLWFEIGRLPLAFEEEGASDVTAEYSLRDDGTLTVDNRCLDAMGAPKQSLGVAEPNEHHPGRLRVSFLPPALRWVPFTHGDYWVLMVDPQYRYALVGTPDRKHLWLLAREPRMDMVAEEIYLSHAREQGFDLEEWIRPLQTGNVVEDEQLSIVRSA